MAEEPHVPVTIVTGYLGAGKTTLLNRLLEQHPDQRIAVIQNEAGAIGVDAELVVDTAEELIEISGGCLCCVVRSDLAEAVADLLARCAGLDHVVVELSGVADPVPVLHTFLKDPRVTNLVRLDAVIAVVDLVHARRQLAARPEAARQVAYADLVLLTKGERMSPAENAVVERDLRAVNSLARIVAVNTAGELPVRLGAGGFSAADTLDTDSPHSAASSEVTTVTIRVPGELDAFLFYHWLGDLIGLKAPRIFRLKGIIALADRTEPLLVQGVHAMVETTWLTARSDRPRASALVVIGHELDEDKLRQGLERCRPGSPLAIAS